MFSLWLSAKEGDTGDVTHLRGSSLWGFVQLPCMTSDFLSLEWIPPCHCPNRIRREPQWKICADYHWGFLFDFTSSFSTRLHFQNLFFNTYWSHSFFCLCSEHPGCVTGSKRSSVELSKQSLPALGTRNVSQEEGPRTATPCEMLWATECFHHPSSWVSPCCRDEKGKVQKGVSVS